MPHNYNRLVLYLRLILKTVYNSFFKEGDSNSKYIISTSKLVKKKKHFSYIEKKEKWILAFWMEYGEFIQSCSIF
jgi:hypothetical protein